MATLRTLTLGYNEDRKRWDLTDDASNRVVRSFATKQGATREGALSRECSARSLRRFESRRSTAGFRRSERIPRSRDPKRYKANREGYQSRTK